MLANRLGDVAFASRPTGSTPNRLALTSEKLAIPTASATLTGGGLVSMPCRLASGSSRRPRGPKRRLASPGGVGVPGAITGASGLPPCERGGGIQLGAGPLASGGAGTHRVNAAITAAVDPATLASVLCGWSVMWRLAQKTTPRTLPASAVVSSRTTLRQRGRRNS